MTFRRPLLAVPIILGALLVPLITSAPARAAEEPVPLEINTTGMGEVECSVNGALFTECEPEYPKGTKLILHGAPGAGVGFAGFSEGEGSASACATVRDCEFTLEEESSVEATFTPLQTFTVNVTGEGEALCEVKGSLAVEACQSEYPKGVTVLVIGSADPGSRFWEFTVGHRVRGGLHDVRSV